MRKPYPEDLPVVATCTTCNKGFSADEEYLSLCLHCALVGSPDPERHTGKKVARALRRHKRLRARIERSKTECQTIGDETRCVWKPVIGEARADHTDDHRCDPQKNHDDRFIFHHAGQSAPAGCRQGQNGPGRRPRFRGRKPGRRLVRECLRRQRPDPCLRHTLAQGGIRPPEECPRLEDTFLDPPRPPGAVPLMQAIEGDGSPWSYVSASILCREAAEFGARWHGCVWSDQTILSKPPRQAGDPGVPGDRRKLTGDEPIGNWTWHGAVPRKWKPTYTERGPAKKVVLHIHHPVGTEAIYRATDTYRAGSYDCDTATTVVCTGEGGIIY